MGMDLLPLLQLAIVVSALPITIYPITSEPRYPAQVFILQAVVIHGRLPITVFTKLEPAPGLQVHNIQPSGLLPQLPQVVHRDLRLQEIPSDMHLIPKQELIH